MGIQLSGDNGLIECSTYMVYLCDFDEVEPALRPIDEAETPQYTRRSVSVPA